MGEALRMNSIWENTIGLQNEHNNTAVEERLNEGLLAHVRGTKQKRDRTISSDLLSKTNCFGNGDTDLESLLFIAKQRNINSSSLRGACKKCSEVGHLTKDCKNFLAKYYEDAKRTQLVNAGVLSFIVSSQEYSNLFCILESRNKHKKKNKSEKWNKINLNRKEKCIKKSKKKHTKR